MWILLVFIYLVGLFLPVYSADARALPQTQDPTIQAKEMLARMTPEEKVGQLFLVTFKGRETGQNAQITDLITRYHVGGVILRSANDNFTGPDDTIADVYRLTSNLQTIEWESSKSSLLDPVSKQNIMPRYIPLLIGVSQEGDQYPYDQILYGMTPLPNEMAIGATWDTSLAEQVGVVEGKELQAIGVNLLMGPSLDVLDVLHVEGGEDLGTRTFGGDPFWVGEMGKATIRGLHQGSNQRLAVISKNFPGRGGSDRLPEDEVATVRKSLDQLKQIELAPFFAVTGSSQTPEITTDGLLVSHIRYQGFQGNIRATTKPVSFDSAALEQLMALTQFNTWHQAGGILVSDDLGSLAVRRFYDPTGQSFDARQVARSAFLAGNDLLYLNNFIATGDPDSYTTITRTVELFAQKYREDTAFAQRVDQSVTRILALKYRLYPEFNLTDVLPAQSGMSEIGKSETVVFEVARKSATLLSPSASELSSILPRPPEIDDRVVFISDNQIVQQCSQCPEINTLSVDALQNAVLKLYGPQAGKQVMKNYLSSYSYLDLKKMLDAQRDLATREVPPIETDLRSADWVVFSMVNIQNERSESLALRRLLSERQEIIRNKKVIVFAFNAPYYLDATDISKLTAYYALYSKTPTFINMAARILFQELQPVGSLPVSVPGVGYDLATSLSPDPDQLIPLLVDVPGETSTQATSTAVTATLEPTAIPTFKVGDTLPLRTGIIFDHNHNVVPDKTIVRFLFTTGGDASTVQQIEAETSQGVARASFRIQSATTLEIRVTSDPATKSGILRLAIAPGESAVVTAITPTQSPSETPEPTPTFTPPIPTPTLTLPPNRPANPPIVDWLVAVLVTWIGAGLVFIYGRSSASLRWGVRWGLMAAIGGFIAYTFIAINFPGSQFWRESIGRLGVALASLLGVGIGWAGGWFWRKRVDQQARQQVGHKTGGDKKTSG
jgi:beta-N-acetylhexosaminidase